MRTDIAAPFAAALASGFRQPRQLLIFKFPVAGWVYVSDQPLGELDGLANEYRPLVIDWGDLADSVNQTTTVDSGEIRSLSLTLWNGTGSNGEPSFSDYFTDESPENVEVAFYQWLVGVPESQKLLIDKFVILDPISFDQASYHLTLDLVTSAVKYDQLCGKLLTKADWPYAFADDIGKGINLAFGNVENIPALHAKAGFTLTLKGSILANTMVLNVHQDLSKMTIPASGIVTIDKEKIKYSGKTATSLTVTQRGYQSDPVEHIDNRDIVELITDNTFFLCEGPVTAIKDVKIEGFTVSPSIYTVYPALNPARIVFSEKPWVNKYSDATRFLQMQMDGVAVGNTALQPSNAYDSADLSTAATIKHGNNTLAIIQTTVNKSKGEILKAYLAVEHWESGNFVSDRVKVNISGIGDIGWLSRPNPADQIVINADVDVDHGHDHEIGGEHVHDFTQPGVTTSVQANVSTKNPSHVHTTSGGLSQDVAETNTNSQVNYWDFSFGGRWERPLGDTIAFTTYPDMTDWKCNIWLNSDVDVNIYFDGIFYAKYIGPIAWAGKAIDPSVSYGRSITIAPAENGVIGERVQFYKATAIVKIPVAVNSTTTAVTAAATIGAGSIAKDGAVKSTGIGTTVVKSKTDVKSFGAANRTVNLNSQSNPSRTIVNLFDITAYVNFDWAWFTNRTITLTYVNNAGEGKSVFILHAFFDIEYLPVQLYYSNKITASVDCLATLVRPDLVMKKILNNKSFVTDAEYDTLTFNNIGATYDALGYRIDGLIDANLTVREALRNICRQVHSRLFTNGGLLKLVLREGHPPTKAISKALTVDNIQLRSLAVTRQPLRDITNSVQLFYNKDYRSTSNISDGFLDSTEAIDAKSVAKFGEKKIPDAFCFDLIRSKTMAEKVAAFYLRTSAWPSSFYSFTAYLDQLDLEKEDVISLTADFNHMHKMPMVIRSIGRVFGSGNARTINALRIVAENLYYILTKVSVADSAIIMDALTLMLRTAGSLADIAQLLDYLKVSCSISKADSILLQETLTTIVEYNSIFQNTASIIDFLKSELHGYTEDAVVIYDLLEAWGSYGFGSGAFGAIKFGGMKEWGQQNPDLIFAYMMLYIAMSVERADTIMLSDNLGWSLGSGFGGANSNGFGLTSFGY